MLGSNGADPSSPPEGLGRIACPLVPLPRTHTAEMRPDGGGWCATCSRGWQAGELGELVVQQAADPAAEVDPSQPFVADKAAFRACLEDAEREAALRGWRWLEAILAEPGAAEPPRPVIPRLAYAGRVTLLAGREKDGKSTLAGAAAAAVSAGAEFLEGPAAEGDVLWLGLEEHVGDLAGRLVQFEARPDRVLIATERFEDPIGRLEAAAVVIRPVLIVIDTLAAVADGSIEDAGSSTAWTPLMHRIARIARETEAANLLLHHARKSDGGYHDSTAIGAGVDLILEMQPDISDGSVRHLRAKGRFPVADSSVRFDGRRFTLASGELALEARVLGFIAAHPHCSKASVRTGVSGRASDIDDAIAALIVRSVVLDEGNDTASRLLVAEASGRGAGRGGASATSPAGRGPDATATRPGAEARPNSKPLGCASGRGEREGQG